MPDKEREPRFWLDWPRLDRQHRSQRVTSIYLAAVAGFFLSALTTDIPVASSPVPAVVKGKENPANFKVVKNGVHKNIRLKLAAGDVRETVQLEGDCTPGVFSSPSQPVYTEYNGNEIEVKLFYTPGEDFLFGETDYDLPEGMDASQQVFHGYFNGERRLLPARISPSDPQYAPEIVNQVKLLLPSDVEVPAYPTC